MIELSRRPGDTLRHVRCHAHRAADGPVMRWASERGCDAGGEKRYDSADRTRRYARAFDREAATDIGRELLLSLLPRKLTRRAGSERRWRSPAVALTRASASGAVRP